MIDMAMQIAKMVYKQYRRNTLRKVFWNSGEAIARTPTNSINRIQGLNILGGSRISSVIPRYAIYSIKSLLTLKPSATLNIKHTLSRDTNVVTEDRCVMDPMVWCIISIEMHTLIKMVNGYVFIAERFISYEYIVQIVLPDIIFETLRRSMSSK